MNILAYALTGESLIPEEIEISLVVEILKAALVLATIVVLAICIIRGKKILSIVAMGAIIALCVVFSSGDSARNKAFNENVKTANGNITNLTLEKYGVELLENPLVLIEDKRIREVEAKRVLLKANDSEGKRIQVSLELTEDNKDILLFSNGKEMAHSEPK